MTLGTATGNTVAASISGFFTGNGAIEVTNSNPRGFINRINAQGEGGYFIQSNGANFQSAGHQINFFRAGNALNITNPVASSEVNGFLFNPTISGQGVSSIFGFRSSLSAATNRWNLYFDGTASNYLASNLLINTTTDAGFRLDVNGTARVQGALTSTGAFPSFIASSTSASANAGYQSIINNGTGNSASFLAYGNAVGFGLGNNAGFGSSSSIVIFGNSGTSTGGTTTIKLRPGGFETSSDALVAYQNSVSIGTTNIPNSSAVLDVESTTKGFLPPRMTTAQRDLIATPAAGLVIYNTSTNTHQGYNGTTWNNFY